MMHAKSKSKEIYNFRQHENWLYVSVADKNPNRLPLLIYFIVCLGFTDTQFASDFTGLDFLLPTQIL
jgi:hypothetical protein